MLNHKSVWLIWENIPESTIIYYLPEHLIDDVTNDVLHLCHHHFINTENDSEVDKALQTLSEWLGKDGKFAHCKVLTDTYPPETKSPTKVIVTGFMM